MGLRKMKELKIMTKGLKPEDANCLLACNCGAIIAFNALDVQRLNKMIVQCEVCKTEILLTDQDYHGITGVI